MKTILSIELEYDPEVTHPEGLASMMDQLLQTVLSVVGKENTEEYGDLSYGDFYVLENPTMEDGNE